MSDAPAGPVSQAFKVPAASLGAFIAGLLRAAEVPPADAELVSRSLLEAELAGHPAHGVSRLPLYVRRLRAGLIAARPQMRVVASTAAACTLDAGNALGPVGAMRGLDLATERAHEHGVGLCGVRHANHAGALDFYVREGAERGFLTMAVSNTPPALAPPGGRTAVIGTNPIAAGLPAAGVPVVIDLATSQVARGRILQAARSGKAIPSGWAVDAAGAPTTDPAAALAGALVPAGGAKGFALALLVEALAAVLTGSGVGAEVSGTFEDSDRPSNVGLCFLAVDAAALQPGFAERMAALAAAIRAVESVAGGRRVRVPGDRGREERQGRLSEGVELPARLVAEVDRLAAELGAPGLA